MNELHENGCTSGYIERKQGGRYEGRLVIEGVDLSPIEGAYFKYNGKQYLWLKRKPLLEYDIASQSYRQRSREPRWEAYLCRQGDGTVAYKGKCVLLRFRYSITAIWDKVLGQDNHRLNFYVERLPMNEQTILQGINARNKERYNGQEDSN